MVLLSHCFLRIRLRPEVSKNNHVAKSRWDIMHNQHISF